MSGALSFQKFRQLLLTGKLLFTMIDDHYASFLSIGLLRMLLGKRTVGIFLRPSKCFESGSVYHTLKRWVFRTVRLLPKITVLTLQPFELKPDHALVAKDWVPDPQLWDIRGHQGFSPETELSRLVKETAAGRTVLSFIGYVADGKGFHFLRDIISCETKSLKNIQVVSAGAVEDRCQKAMSDIKRKGAHVIEKYLSDEEIESLYAVSDLIWCCYVPDYDQASGIFGRALQTNRTPVVRAGSMIEDYARSVGVDVIALDYGNCEDAVRLLNDFSLSGAAKVKLTEQFFLEKRDAFTSKLLKYL